tara:strand:- start:597 stop:803 length:207 start_codon:yes stop_codon:yes gene_type:complete
MTDEDLCGTDLPDNPNGVTCHATGRTYQDLDYFNVGTDERDEWEPFLNEETYLDWMKANGREIPELQS